MVVQDFNDEKLQLCWDWMEIALNCCANILATTRPTAKDFIFWILHGMTFNFFVKGSTDVLTVHEEFSKNPINLTSSECSELWLSFYGEFRESYLERMVVKEASEVHPDPVKAYASTYDVSAILFHLLLHLEILTTTIFVLIGFWIVWRSESSDLLFEENRETTDEIDQDVDETETIVEPVSEDDREEQVEVADAYAEIGCHAKNEELDRNLDKIVVQNATLLMEPKPFGDDVGEEVEGPHVHDEIDYQMNVEEMDRNAWKTVVEKATLMVTLEQFGDDDGKDEVEDAQQDDIDHHGEIEEIEEDETLEPRRKEDECLADHDTDFKGTSRATPAFKIQSIKRKKSMLSKGKPTVSFCNTPSEISKKSLIPVRVTKTNLKPTQKTSSDC